MDTLEVSTSGSDNEHDGLVDANLQFGQQVSMISREYFTAYGAYHSLNDFLHFANYQLQDQADSFLILAVLLNDLFEQPLGFLAIFALFDTSITRHSRVLLHSTKTNNLISILDQLINQPIKRKVGVFILVRATQKRPAPPGTLIPLMLVVESQGEICSVAVIKGIE